MTTQRGQWWRFALLLVICGLVLVPVLAVLWLSVRPSAQSTSTATFTPENFVRVFTQTQTLT
jgi:ABC-type glycerol-3-phosphate transport system permease component